MRIIIDVPLTQRVGNKVECDDDPTNGAINNKWVLGLVYCPRWGRQLSGAYFASGLQIQGCAVLFLLERRLAA
jgi:hypothetical protein